MTEPVGGETPTIETLQAELTSTREALSRANAEAAERRKKLEAIEKAEKERQQADMGEVEKLTRQLVDLQSERDVLSADLQSTRIRHAIIAKAVELGFENPEDAFQLADLSAVKEEDGKVSGFEKSLEALAKSNRLPMKAQSGDSLGTPRRKQQIGVAPKLPEAEGPVTPFRL